MDDDIVVDFRQLFAYLRAKDKYTLHLDRDSKQHYLSGYLFKNVVPIRLRPSKWFVTEDEFRDRVYPDYLSGWMYVTTPYTAKALAGAAFKAKSNIFWIDDIWLTGILRAQTGIPIAEEMNHLFSANSQFLDCCITDLERDKLKCPFIAGPNGGDHMLIKKLAKSILQRCFTNQDDPYFNTQSPLSSFKILNLQVLVKNFNALVLIYFMVTEYIHSCCLYLFEMITRVKVCW